MHHILIIISILKLFNHSQCILINDYIGFETILISKMHSVSLMGINLGLIVQHLVQWVVGSIPHGVSIELFLVTKAVVCAILSVG